MPTSWPLILPWLVTVVLAAALWQYPALGWGLMAASTAALVAAVVSSVHHAEVIALKGDSYRIKDRDLGRVPTATAEDQ